MRNAFRKTFLAFALLTALGSAGYAVSKVAGAAPASAAECCCSDSGDGPG